MGPKHTKDRNPKFQDPDRRSSKADSYDTSWIESIERSFFVVWCDASIGLNENSNDDTNTLTQLARIVNKRRQLVHTFNELKPCQDFITHVNNVCLIVSGSMGEKLVPLVHNLDQVHSIYVFCINKAKHEAWSKPYNKIRGVFTDIEEICECLKTFFISRSSAEYDRLQFDILKEDLKLPTTDNQELPLIYSMLCKIILFNMNLPRQEMINYCRTEYTTEYQIQLIDEFDSNYNKHDPIWWFTREHFFQGIINQALRTHDLYSLCKMSPYIKDLNKKITELQKKQMITSQPLILYFSQLISNDDFNKLKSNQGGLMCINQFLLANTEQAIALMFIKHQTSTTSANARNINVLFKISVLQTNEPNVSYANIGAVSQFVHEKEYLFSMESIFRIEEVERLDEIPSACFVHLLLVDKHDPQLTNLTQLINQEHTLSNLGDSITTELYKYKSINKLFEQALNSKTQQIRPILLHYNMAIIHDCLNEYDKALNEYRLAINLTRNSIPNSQHKDNICLIPFYSNMGFTFQQQQKSTHAFDHAFRALDILSKDQDNSIYKKEISASCYYNLGAILDQQGKVSEAKIYHEQALKCRGEYLPEDSSKVTVL